MQTCKNCEQPRASNARICPHCGHRKTHWFTWLIAGFFLMIPIGAVIDGIMKQFLD